MAKAEVGLRLETSPADEIIPRLRLVSTQFVANRRMSRPNLRVELTPEEEALHRELIEAAYAVLVKRGMTLANHESTVGGAFNTFVNSQLFDIVEKYRAFEVGL